MEVGAGRGRCLGGTGLGRTHSALTHAPAGRPCVDCHAFEFMQRALQDLRKTAYSLDARVSPLARRVMAGLLGSEPLREWRVGRSRGDEALRAAESPAFKVGGS